MATVLVWAAFVVLVLIILAFDLGFFNREEKAITARQALLRTLVYFLLACGFTVFVYYSYEHHWFDLGKDGKAAAEASADEHAAVHHEPWFRLAYPFEVPRKGGAGKALPHNGTDAATMFFTGYLVEQSLSMDNIFVIALILTYFQVPAILQHRVLFWGIMGALIMRGVMIGLGAVVIESFHWVIYLFGLLLIYTAFKMLVSGDEEVDFEEGKMVRLFRRFLPYHSGFVGDHFLTRIHGKLHLTPLALALVVVETSDLLFAVDSIPAVFGITHDPFLVFTSNVFAILGLRSLYFALADLLDKFRYLKYSLVVVLAFVGVKMLAHSYFEISPLSSLTLIVVALAAGIGASFVFPAPEHAPHEDHVDHVA